MKWIQIPLFALLCAWAGGCATPPPETVFQTATIDALMAGVYDGDLTLAELRRHGDFGIGTYDRLDGEMVLLDGVFYQIRANGMVVRPGLEGETPFAAVCAFHPDLTVPLPAGADLEAVEAALDRAIPDRNLFQAIRIDGRFRMVRTRSVPPQKRPYPPLKEVAATQPVFDLEEVDGTVVGFRCPAFVAGVNVPGYHLHFISRNRAQGGHLLALELASGTAQVDVLDRWALQLPRTKDFAEVDLARDRRQDLTGVEKDRPMK